jgi:2,3-bisphosphoglycerate-dependent phosphoglycerate mutase
VLRACHRRRRRPPRAAARRHSPPFIPRPRAGQGLDKAETAAKYGDAQVGLWRRSYDVPPPAMEPGHPFWLGSDPRYAHLPPAALPRTESTATTGARVVPYWRDVLQPEAAAGKRLLIVAHGNSLRALVKHIDGLSDEAIVALNIPTGVPLVYNFDQDWRPIKHPQAMSGLSGRYLGDQDAIRASIEGVANQSKAKK